MSDSERYTIDKSLSLQLQILSKYQQLMIEDSRNKEYSIIIIEILTGLDILLRLQKINDTNQPSL